MLWNSLALVMGLLALTWTAAAGEGKKATDDKPVSDAQFVKLASASDLAEINLGKIALKQAESPEVKRFAEHMVADHTKSSKELLPLANKKGLAAAPQMDTDHKALADKLLVLKGTEFDRVYMKHMVMDHKKAVELFRSASKSLQDEGLRAFALKTLPVIQEHYTLAQQISAKLTGDAKPGRER